MIDTAKLIEIGNDLSEKLSKEKLRNNSLIISVDKDYFKKLDEDIFYKLRQEGDKTEFKPSDSSVTLDFSNLSIIIKEQD